MSAWQVLQGTASTVAAAPFITACGLWQLVQMGAIGLLSRASAACTLLSHCPACSVWQVAQTCTRSSAKARRDGILFSAGGWLVPGCASAWHVAHPSGACT